MASGPRRGTFAFELSKPNKKGTLMKQGALHKAFKYRFFVLYPGFLVYYDTENKWKVDLAKGETLGNRIGAIKLKNGTVNIARDAPKGCKFGLIVYAPDPVNKRQSYLLNAVNKGDRDDWIQAIKSSIPRTNSPRQGRKDKAPKKEEVKKESLPPPHPPSTMRQDTATTAALLASEEGGNDKETCIDAQLQAEVEPSITVRHDTASVAALLDSQEARRGKGEGEEEGADDEDETITSFDEEAVSKALGQKESGHGDSSDEGSDVPLSPEPTEAQTPTPEPSQDLATEADKSGKGEKEEKESTPQVIVNGDRETEGGSSSAEPAVPLETERKVESSVNMEGKVEVVTSVKVLSNGKDNEQGQEQNGDIARSSTGEEERRGSGGSEVEVEVHVAVKGNSGGALTVTMVNSDSNSSDSEDEGHPTSPTSPSIPDTPSSIPDSNSDARTSVSSSEPSTPAITIDKVNTLTRVGENMTQEEEDEAAKRLAAKGHKRRSSEPFIEKRGFLYKEGGQRKTWKMRYFVLQPGSFTYYKTNPNTKPLGEVKLKNLQIRYPGAGQRKQSFQFTVHTESSWNKRSDYVLAAQSDAELKEWIKAFKLAGQKNTSPSPSPPNSDEETVQNGTIPVSS